MTEVNSHKKITAIYIMIFLMMCCGAALSTFVLRHDKLVSDHLGFTNFLNGKMIFSFEKKFEEELLIRDHMVGTWGAIQYGLFNSGAKKVVVGSDEWLFSTEEFDKQPKAAEAEARLLALVGKVNEYLQSQNIKLAVVLVPAKARIYDEYLGRHKVPQHRTDTFDRFRSAVADMGVVVPNLEQVYREAKTADGQLYYRLDTHWTSLGAKLAAETLAREITIEGLEKTEFKAETAEPVVFEGDLEKYIKTGVLHKWLAPQQETFSKLKVEKANAAEGGDLFGEQVIPVTLIGTSYSAIEKWNFEESLKLALQADVLNLADEGQGPLEPMAKFLKSTDFKNSHTKLVIWEIPERFISVAYPDVVFPDFIEGAQ